MAKKKTNKEEVKKTFAVEGEKVNVEACPKCKSELVMKTKDGLEYFECENCRFVKDKKKELKKEEDKNKSEEFPDVEIGFDPFQQQ